MITIARFSDVPLAHLAASKLRSEGFSCSVVDDYLIGINWQYSLAIGGVKLMVQEIDADEAIKCLGQDESHLLCEIEFEDEISGGTEQCEECGSKELGLAFPARKVTALCLLVSVIPVLPFFFLSYVFRWRFTVKCLKCGHLAILE
jgi:hypothetical protein